MPHPQPINNYMYNFTAAPKNQHNYLLPIQYVATLLIRRLKTFAWFRFTIIIRLFREHTNLHTFAISNLQSESTSHIHVWAM